MGKNKTELMCYFSLDERYVFKWVVLGRKVEAGDIYTSD